MQDPLPSHEERLKHSAKWRKAAGWALLKAMVFPTIPILETADRVKSGLEEDKSILSNGTIEAIHSLKQSLSGVPGQEWTQATNEPPPNSLTELTRQMALVGMDPELVLSGKWTPASVFPVLRGALQRRNEQMQLQETPDGPEWSKYHPPKNWRAQLKKAGLADSRQRWPSFINPLEQQGKAHRKSNGKLVSIRLDALQEMGIEPPAP